MGKLLSLGLVLGASLIFQTNSFAQDLKQPSTKDSDEFASSNNTLIIIGDPADFLVSFFGRVLATQYMQGDNTEDMRNIASHYFSKDLNQAFNKIYNTEKSSAQLGCIDFNPFTGMQEISRGFLVDSSNDNAGGSDKPMKIGVRITASSLEDLQKPRLYFDVKRTDQGFKVEDIHYESDKSSLKSRLKACMKK